MPLELGTLLDMPWRLTNELRRILAAPPIHAGLRLHGVEVASGARIFGMPIVQRHRGSTITIGPNAVLRSWRSSNPLAPHHPIVLSTRTREASISIGEGCGLTGTTIVSAARITLGDRVLVGANSTIVDTDFHPLDAVARQALRAGGSVTPVVVGDDVFIGMECLILPGASIGRGSVIGARSVVTGEIPAGVLAAGTPARVIRKLDGVAA